LNSIQKIKGKKFHIVLISLHYVMAVQLGHNLLINQFCQVPIKQTQHEELSTYKIGNIGHSWPIALTLKLKKCNK
jgi:hypothetical protein